MNSFQLALAIGAAFVGLISVHLDRALLWITAGAVSFIASTAYGRYGLPLPPLFTAVCDACVCIGIYLYATQRWELGVYRLFQLSVLVSIVFLGMIFLSPVETHFWYVTVLECINWAVLLLITGTAVAQWVGADGDRTAGSPRRLVRWAERALLSPAPPRAYW